MTYPVVLPHDTTTWDPYLVAFLNEIWERIAKDLDAVVVITGEEGMGKSTLAWHLAVLLDPCFDLERLAYGAEEFIQAHWAGRKYPGTVTLLDESVVGGYSRDAMTAANKRFNAYLMQARELRGISLLCFPRIVDLDRGLKDRAAYWIDVEAQGRAVVRWPKRSATEAETQWRELLELEFPAVPAYDRERASVAGRKRQRIGRFVEGKVKATKR